MVANTCKKMVSRDHFICNLCNYEWRTRKDVGEPSVCPNYKGINICNNSKKIRKEKEKIIAEEQEKYQQKLSKLNEQFKPIYYLILWKKELLISGIVFLVLITNIGLILIVLSSVGFIIENSLRKPTQQKSL